MELHPTQNFQLQLPYILQHVIEGEIKKGKHFGVHFYQPEKHLIDEIINEPNELGIWEAKIKIRHHKTNNWVKKTKSSTFFPTHWNENQLIEKLEEAFTTKKIIKNFKHIGTTTCGVSIVFLFQQNIIASCFPLYEKN